MYQSERFDRKLFLSALAAGLVAWIIDILLYSMLVDHLWRPLLIGLMFFILTLLVSATVLMVSRAEGGFDEEFLFLSSTGAIIGGLAVLLVVTLVLSILFEAIYDYEGHTTTSASSYLFLLDESGSMSDSDPSQLRYSAVEEVLSGMPSDFPYAVYAFSDSTQLVRNMSPVSSGSDYVPPSMGGMTNIRSALETVLGDIQSETWSGGSSPKVVLLTDGYASDIDLFHSVGDLLDRYRDAGVSISTVGLGQVDEALLTNIAQNTGGVFVPVDQAGDLSSAMQTAAMSSVSRDLLSQRVTPGRNLFYGILRVVFLLLLGCVLALTKDMACARMGEHGRILGLGCAAALLGALAMELGTGIGLPAVLCWLVLWLLFSLVPAMITVQNHMNGVSNVHSNMYSGGSLQFK